VDEVQVAFTASQIKAVSRQAGISTASMGKFDRRLDGEKPGERQPLGKRQKFLPVADRSGAERSSASELVDRLLRERSEEVLDVGKAIGKFEAAAREERFQKKRKAAAAAGDAGPDEKTGKMGGRKGVKGPRGERPQGTGGGKKGSKGSKGGDRGGGKKSHKKPQAARGKKGGKGGSGKRR
jgi:regulator of ribosome biosynthesis